MSEKDVGFDPTQFASIKGPIGDNLAKSTLPRWAGWANRFLPLPQVARDLLKKLGHSDLPETQMALGQQEQIISPDQTIVGLRLPENQNHMLGVSVFMGENDYETIRGHRVKANIGEESPVPTFTVNEGRYNLMLFAPPPAYDLITNSVTYFMAKITVMNQVDETGENVYGTSTGFFNHNGGMGEVNWMIVNEWAETGQLSHACRAIDGIHLPELDGEQTILKMHALEDEKADALQAAGALNGSGLVAVQFMVTNVSMNRTRRILPTFNPNPWQEQAAPASYGMKSLGTTAFTASTSGALAGFSGGEPIPVGSPVLLSVVAGENVQTQALDNPKFVNHRALEGKQTQAQIFASWPHIPNHIAVGS